MIGNKVAAMQHFFQLFTNRLFTRDVKQGRGREEVEKKNKGVKNTKEIKINRVKKGDKIYIYFFFLFLLSSALITSGGDGRTSARGKASARLFFFRRQPRVTTGPLRSSFPPQRYPPGKPLHFEVIIVTNSS